MDSKCDIDSCGLDLGLLTNSNQKCPFPPPLDCAVVDVIDNNLNLLNDRDGDLKVMKTGEWRNFKDIFEGRSTELI